MVGWLFVVGGVLSLVMAGVAQSTGALSGLPPDPALWAALSLGGFLTGAYRVWRTDAYADERASFLLSLVGLLLSGALWIRWTWDADLASRLTRNLRRDIAQSRAGHGTAVLLGREQTEDLVGQREMRDFQQRRSFSEFEMFEERRFFEKHQALLERKVRSRLTR